MLGIDRHRQADPGVPRDHGRRLHRRHGAEARRDRGAAPRLDQAAEGFLRPVPRSRRRRAGQDRARRRHAPARTSAPSAASTMLYRISKNGFFLACTAIASATTTQPVDQQGKPTVREVSEHKCPDCGREMIKRSGRFGEFLGCSRLLGQEREGRAELLDDHQPRQGGQARCRPRPSRSRRRSRARSAAARCSCATASAGRSSAARSSPSAARRR